MPKCSKVKNPCKICLTTVTERTGVQCNANCDNWVHYECLNFTPGKIEDIKAGIIKIHCPCPDCKSELPKEYRTNEPYSCTNVNCPANLPPFCGKSDCPSGRPGTTDPPATGCGLQKCGEGCKQDSSTGTRCPSDPPQNIQASPPSYNKVGKISLQRDAPGDYDHPGPYKNQQNAFNALEQMCNTVSQLSGQINNLVCKMQDTLQEKSDRPQSRSACAQANEKQLRKPCYCPGNPCHK